MSRAVVAAVTKRLAEHELEALVCVSPENVAYAAGFVVPSQTLMRWRHAAAVVTAGGREAMLCVDMEATTVRQRRPDLLVKSWTEFGGDAMRVLAELLGELGVTDGRVGIELDYLPAADYARLQSYLPGVTLLAADPLLTDVRQIKTGDELALLSQLSRISDRAIRTALESVRAGDTEMDIAAALTRSVYEQEAHSFKLMIVATGERSQLPNVGPTRRVLTPGDVCRVEIFSVIDGYHAGVCRTAVVGNPPPEAARIYRTLVECKHVVLDAIRPGATGEEVYRAYRRTFDRLDLDPIAFVGHSIGVNLHEPPYLGPHSEQALAEGMVFGVEPLAYRTGHGFGMQIKDMVAVTASGSRLLSDVTDTDELFVIGQ